MYSEQHLAFSKRASITGQALPHSAAEGFEWTIILIIYVRNQRWSSCLCVFLGGDTLPCYADLFFGVVTSEDSLKAVFTEKTEEIDWTGSHQAWVEQVLRSATIRSFN